MKWLTAFLLACVGTVAGGLLLVWAATGFSALAIHGSVLALLIAGAVVSSALGIGLMALIFASGRNNYDDAAYHYVLKQDHHD